MEHILGGAKAATPGIADRPLVRGTSNNETPICDLSVTTTSDVKIACTVTGNFTEGTTTVTIPSGVKTVHFAIDGAHGGQAYATRFGTGLVTGGLGSKASGTINITKIAAAEGAGWNRELFLLAGANGQLGYDTEPNGGDPNGASGGKGSLEPNQGGGGGGESAIQLSTAQIVAVVGGGGGAGGYGGTTTHVGKGGKGATGTPEISSTTPWGNGTKGAKGDCTGGGAGGQGGAIGKGGAGGAGGVCGAKSGRAGKSGTTGGAGGSTPSTGTNLSGGGGGGGGGYHDGGGGGGGATAGGGGGGAGSGDAHSTWLQSGYTFVAESSSATKSRAEITYPGSTTTTDVTIKIVTAPLVTGYPGVPYFDTMKITAKGTIKGIASSALVGTISIGTQQGRNGGGYLCTAALTKGAGSCTFTNKHYNIYTTCSYCAVTTPITGWYHDGSSTVEGLDFTVKYRSVRDPVTVSTPTVTTETAGKLIVKSTFTPASYAPSPLAGSVEFLDKVTGSSTAPAKACTATVPSVETKGEAATLSCKFGTLVPGDKYLITAKYLGTATKRANSSYKTSTPTYTYNAQSVSSAATYTVPKSASSTTLSVTPGTAVTYGAQVSLTAQVRGIPKGDKSPGTVTYENGAGTALTCTGNAQANPASLPTSATSTTRTAPTCVFKPTATTAFKVKAVYAGDSESTSTTQQKTFKVNKAKAATTVSAGTSTGTDRVGVPVNLTAAVTDTGVSKSSPTFAPPVGPVKFFKGSTAIVGCTAVTTKKTTSTGDYVATCNSVITPTTLSTTSFHAKFCPTAGSPAACTNWTTSTSPTVTYTPSKATVKVTLTPAATVTHPATVAGGEAVTVTATITLTQGSTAIAGTVTFHENSHTITATPSGTCTSVSVSSSKATCKFRPVAGSTDHITAAFTPSATSLVIAPSTPSSTYLSVGGLPTTTSLGVLLPGSTTPISSGTLSYGVPVTAEATVSAPTTPTTHKVTIGTVTFTVGGTAVCKNVSMSSGVAKCASIVLGAGSQKIIADYNDTTKTDQASSATDTFHVKASATKTTLNVAAQASPNTTMIVLSAKTTNTSSGATKAPLGKITFTAGSTTSGCGKVALVATPSGATATATCEIATPTKTTTYTASFSPTLSTEFSPSSSTGEKFNPGAGCNANFGALWVDGGKSAKFGFSAFGITGDALTVDLGTVKGTCSAAKGMSFKTATLSLLGGTITSSAKVSGTIGETGSTGATTVLCISGGSITLPAGWGIGKSGSPTTHKITLSPTAKLCFDLTNVSGTSGTLGNVTNGELTKKQVTLPFGVPASTVTYKLSLTFKNGATPSVTITVAPTTTPASTVYVTASVTITVAHGSVTAAGTLSLLNAPFGAPTATFTVSVGKTGKIGGSVTLSVVTTYKLPIPGVTLKHIAGTLSSSTGVSISATALLGTSPDQMTASVSGTYQKKKWTLSVTATHTGSWKPFSSLTLTDVTLSGTVTITPAGDTVDIEAGSPATKSKTETALATWKPISGLSLTIDCLAFSYGVTPKCASDKSEDPTDPTIAVEGAVSIATTGGITAGFEGAVDLKSGAVGLSLDATASTISVHPVTGVTLTLKTLKVTGDVGAGMTVVGSASAVIPSIGATTAKPITVSVTDQAGDLVVWATGISLSAVGVPLTGFFAYASGPVAKFTVTGFGRVALAKGFNGLAHYTVSSGVQSALTGAGFTLPAGGVITFSASWAPGGSAAFAAELTSASSSVPFLAVPGGGTITSASLMYKHDELDVTLTGTVPVPGATAAPISITLALESDGAFTGTVKVTKLSLFGQTFTLKGTLDRSSAGKITANVDGKDNSSFQPFPGIGITFKTVEVKLGTDGFGVSGTATADTVGTLSLTATFKSFKNWNITVTATAAHSWSPVTDVTFSPQFSGTITDDKGDITFVLSATGAGGASLFSFSPGGVTVSIKSVKFGDGDAPSDCDIEKDHDYWLSVDGTLSITLASTTGKVAVSGCYDITASNLDLNANVTSLSFSALTGNVTMTGLTVEVSLSSGAYKVRVLAPVKIKMPSGGTVSITGVIAVQSGGGFVVGAAANLSAWLGSDGDTAHLYYSSVKVHKFTTGTATLGKINLVPGINFAVDFTLPTSVRSALGDVGIHLTGGSVAAIGTANFKTKTYALTVTVTLGSSGLQLFKDGTTSLSLEKGFLQVVVAPSKASFSVGLTALLHIPAPSSTATASTITLTGELTLSTTGVTISLSVGTETPAKGTGWKNAFGITGFDVKYAALQGGISDGTLDVGFAGTITSLPPRIASIIGLQTGAKISFAFNLNPFLLSLSLGTASSNTTALEPLEHFGGATLLKVNYASLYASPDGAKIGTVTYPAGFSMAFDATILTVHAHVSANVSFTPPSFAFTASVSKITFGVLSIGPVAVKIAASKTSFIFKLKGTATLGPASFTLIPDVLRVGGKLTATVTVTITLNNTKRKLSAYLMGTIYLFITHGSVQWCTGWLTIPYPCGWTWSQDTFTFHLGKTGFSVTGTGVSITVDTFTLAFAYSGGISVSHTVSTPDAVAYVTGHRTPLTLVSSHTTRSSSAGVGTLTPLGTATLTKVGPITSGPGAAPVAGQDSGTASGTGFSVTHNGQSTPLGTWATTGSMSTGRLYPAVATLKNGDVLVAGGEGANRTPVASAEIYNPAKGTWSVTGPLPVATAGASAQVLANGDVLVTGGIGKSGAQLSTASVYDPTTATFTPTGKMTVGRAFAGSAVLPNGDVLIAGGLGSGHQKLASSELYDPSTSTFTPGPSMPTGRALPAVATLGNGSVLLAGGLGSSGTLATAVSYNPATNTWSSAGTMNQPRMFASAAVLHNGDVLVVGDGDDADLYNPTTNTWTLTGGMATPKTMAAVTTLANGDVLVAGGDASGSSEDTAELYEPTTGTWVAAGSMPSARSGGVASLLSNGQVLVAGGGNLTTSGGGFAANVETTATVYTPAAPKKTTTKTTTQTKTKVQPKGATPPPPPPPATTTTPTTPTVTIPVPTTTSPTSAPHPKGTASSPGTPTATCAPPRVTPPGSTPLPGSVRDAMAALPDGRGYWLASATGGVFSCKKAQFYGSPTAMRVPVSNIVGIASTPHGKGYWLVGDDGGVFAFGDAGYYGSLPALGVHVTNVVGIASTPDGKGYWMVASDGGIFAFGDAQFYGSMGGKPLNQPVVAMAPVPSGKGYWLVASDGGIFSFGSAQFHGSTGSLKLNEPIVAMTTASTGGGYWLVASDGGVFAFTAPSYGSTGGHPPPSPVLGLVPTPTGKGYSVVDSAGTAFHFGA